MKFLVITGLIFGLGATAMADGANPYQCASKDGKTNYEAALSSAMDTLAVSQKTSGGVMQKATLVCSKADEKDADASGRSKIMTCREPNKADAGFMAVVYKSGDVYEVELSSASFAGPHFLGLLTCN